MPDSPRDSIYAALGNFVGNRPVRDGAAGLLNALGYSSQRTVEAGGVEGFLENFAPDGKLTKRQYKLLDSWTAVEIVFQFTANEIDQQSTLLDTRAFQRTRSESFLFLAVDMAKGAYPRTHLAETSRVVNGLFAMPVILLFRHGATLTLAATHRRPHRRDNSRDVIERVTLVKDIRIKSPHRAHVEILSDLALTRIAESGVRSFDDLHAKWEKTLDIEALNKRFYRDLFAWFQDAVANCRFPDDGAGSGSAERHVIRLITRLLFIWFLKEKSLVPDDLFEDRFARSALKDHSLDKSDYYKAVLQNLFFATLNTEIDKRVFSKESDVTYKDFSRYRYRDLLQDPDGFVDKLKQVPFVNGGLFDCLDDFTSEASGGKRIDAFSDDEADAQTLQVPASLFLDEQHGLFPLFRRYKFTIEESTPLDHEVALDPELLGRVFENLLAAYNPETRETARKNTGSYYTPRPVVDYMVRSALAEALLPKIRPVDGDDQSWRDKLLDLLDQSTQTDHAYEDLKETDRRAVVAAIADIRTLDTAVGSGAFPMGILQALTLALRRVDPGNVLWEQVQKKCAIDRAERAFDTENLKKRDDELHEISATFEKYGRSDFGRKLYLIQNGIYGVDIQPIACQIAKLRFFISLVIEQNRDASTPNLGIKPLPNLETRFVAADTLIGLEGPTQLDIGQTDEIQVIEEELKLNRERHFLAIDSAEKLELQKNDALLRAKLSSQLEQFGLTTNSAKTVARWDPYNQNQVAKWFDPEYMFGISGGFDVVIGNPPYIQLQKNQGRGGNLYRSEGYETFARTGDIYQLFYERGCKLLTQGVGTLAYITSNSWLRAEYGRRLRKFFASRHTPLTLIEMGKNVFDNAIVDTAVLIVRSGTSPGLECQAVDIEQTSDRRFPPLKGDWGTLKPEGERPWTALSAVTRSVISKMHAVGTPLKDWDISIYRGILTGYNDAFIVSTAVRDRLIAEDPSSEGILKPILRGRDIARYRANWRDLWLIASFPSLNLDINDYPSVKKYLLGFGKQRLVQKGILLPDGNRSRKHTPHHWYELQDTCAYHGIFGHEKLFWMHMSPEGRFAYSDDEMYCNQKGFVVTGKNLKYLCAVMNSTAISSYMKQFSVTTGMGLMQWDKFSVEKVPIPRITSSEECYIEKLVDTILSIKTTDSDDTTEDIERDIDKFLFERYGFNMREIQSIENTNRDKTSV